MIGAIVGDFFFRQGDPGIGRLIDNYRAELASEQLFAAIVASSLLGIARVRARRLGAASSSSAAGTRAAGDGNDRADTGRHVS